MPERLGLQLFIHVHPAEERGIVPSRRRVVDEIKNAFAILPVNVFIISLESRVSCYAAVLRCNVAIIYSTKMGVELNSMSPPVIVGLEVWIRNRDLMLDAWSIKGYFDLMGRPPLYGSMEKTKPETFSLTS